MAPGQEPIALSRSLSDKRTLGAGQQREAEIGPIVPPALSDDSLAWTRRVVEEHDAPRRDPVEQDFGAAADERIERPGRAVDHQQVDLLRKRGQLVPAVRPVAWILDDGRMAQGGI